VTTYTPPSDYNDRRRRIRRWKKRHPRKAFQRKLLLHRDGSTLTLAELLDWRAKATALIIDANLKTRVFDD